MEDIVTEFKRYNKVIKLHSKLFDDVIYLCPTEATYEDKIMNTNLACYHMREALYVVNIFNKEELKKINWVKKIFKGSILKRGESES